VARQRDLSELIGDSIPGAERLNFSDALQHWEGRFHHITLEDRNLPAIAEKRVLKCKTKAARDELNAAFEQTAKVRESVMNVLLTSEGDLWKRQRKLMAQAFTPKRIRSYAETMVAVTDQGLPWQRGDVVNIHDEMSRITMAVVAKVLFGTGLSHADVERVHGAMEVINEYYANSPEAIFRIPPRIPTPRNVRLRRAVKQIDEVIYRLIEQKRSEGLGDDLLSTLLMACDEGGQGMTDQQLRDEAVTLFLAGHETTALALAHTLYLISKYPEVERRLTEEIDQVLGGALASHEDVKRLPYTSRVIKEGMRLYPPAWTTGRAALEDVEIGGYLIPKGAQLLMAQWIVHRDPRYYPNPEAFDPDRWLAPEMEDLPRYAFFPFGGGPRVCIGNHFATMEATLLLVTIVQRYHLELLPGQSLALAPSVTLRPKGSGLRMRVSPRPEGSWFKTRDARTAQGNARPDLHRPRGTAG
jgi:cytochrome P450